MFGVDSQLADLTAARISVWRDEQRSRQVPKLDADGERQLQPISAAAVNRPLAALRHLLQLACDEWECLTKAPLIRLLHEPKGRVRYLTDEEQVRLLVACGESKEGGPAAHQGAGEGVPAVVGVEVLQARSDHRPLERGADAAGLGDATLVGTGEAGQGRVDRLGHGHRPAGPVLRPVEGHQAAPEVDPALPGEPQHLVPAPARLQEQAR